MVGNIILFFISWKISKNVTGPTQFMLCVWSASELFIIDHSFNKTSWGLASYHI